MLLHSKTILELLEKVQKLQKASSMTERLQKKRKLNSSDLLENVKKSSSPASVSDSSHAKADMRSDETEVIEDSEDDVVKWIPSSDAEENEAENGCEL